MPRDVDDMVDPGPADACRHIALLYAGPAEYLLGLRRFIRAGGSDDEATLVAVPQGNSQLLRRELRGESASLTFTDMTELGRNPARIIPEIIGFARRHPGRRTRCVAEPTWPGRSPAELQETARHEALANLAFREIRVTILCPYSTADLPSSVVADVACTHPFLVSGGQQRASSRYPGADAQPRRNCMLPTPPGDASVLDYATDLRPVRRFIAASSHRTGLAAERAADLVLAVSELAANTLRHTDAGGTVTIWHTPDHVVCQVHDSGWITDPLAGHRMPPDSLRRGSGLWLVNQLCDLTQTRTTPSGTVTRLHMRVPATASR